MRTREFAQTALVSPILVVAKLSQRQEGEKNPCKSDF